MDLTSSLEAKFGARSGQVHQIRGKTWEILLPQDTNVGKKSKFLGQISNSQGKIWGICPLYFWRQNLGPQQEFQRQILGPSPPPPPRPPNMAVPHPGPEFEQKSRFKTSRLQIKVGTLTWTSLRPSEKIYSQAGSTGNPVALEATQ